jgi:hypothetical protein
MGFDPARVFDRVDAVVGEHIWNFANFAVAPGILRADGTNRKGIFTRAREPKVAAENGAPALALMRLRFSEYFGYASGEAANNLTFSTVSAFLLIYYTDVAGIAADATHRCSSWCASCAARHRGHDGLIAQTRDQDDDARRARRIRRRVTMWAASPSARDG